MGKYSIQKHVFCRMHSKHRDMSFLGQFVYGREELFQLRPSVHKSESYDLRSCVNVCTKTVVAAFRILHVLAPHVASNRADPSGGITCPLDWKPKVKPNLHVLAAAWKPKVKPILTINSYTNQPKHAIKRRLDVILVCLSSRIPLANLHKESQFGTHDARED